MAPTTEQSISWQQKLAAFHNLVREAASKEDGNLRFELKFIKVSDIAGQYYCEKKVELASLQEEKESPEMQLGRMAHEELLKETVKVKRETLWREIFAGKPVGVREMPLAGKSSGTLILGVADGVFFYKGSPLLLLEYKFSKRPTPFPDHHVQARVYCHLLKLMGFDVSLLKYALVMAPPESKGSPALVRIPSYIVSHLKEEVLSLDLEPAGKAHIYVNPYDETKTLEELEWALPFWMDQRDPIPTTMAGKCRACQFKNICEFSLAKTN